MGSLSVPTDASNTIPPLSVLNSGVITGIYAYTLSGSVTLNVLHNGIIILDNVTITTTPSLTTFSSTITTLRYDQISITLTSVTSALGMVLEFD